MTVAFQSGPVMARWAHAGIMTGVSATGALGLSVAAVCLILAQTIARCHVLRQVAARLQIFVQCSSGQRFKFFETVDNVRMFLLRFGRHVEQLFNVAVADAKSEDFDSLLSQSFGSRTRITAVGVAVCYQENGHDRIGSSVAQNGLSFQQSSERVRPAAVVADGRQFLVQQMAFVLVGRSEGQVIDVSDLKRRTNETKWQILTQKERTTRFLDEKVTTATRAASVDTVKSAKSFLTNFNSLKKFSAPTEADESTKKTNSTFWPGTLRKAWTRRLSTSPKTSTLDLMTSFSNFPLPPAPLGSLIFLTLP